MAQPGDQGHAVPELPHAALLALLVFRGCAAGSRRTFLPLSTSSGPHLGNDFSHEGRGLGLLPGLPVERCASCGEEPGRPRVPASRHGHADDGRGPRFRDPAPPLPPRSHVPIAPGRQLCSSSSRRRRARADPLRRGPARAAGRRRCSAWPFTATSRRRALRLPAWLPCFSIALAVARQPAPRPRRCGGGVRDAGRRRGPPFPPP